MFFLWDNANYLNHYYALWLILFVMALVPAHRSASVDVYMGLARRTDAVPAWCLYLLRFQIACIFVFGGIAKLNGDWLAGWPLRGWLADRGDYALVGPLLTRPATAVLMAWGGMGYDFLACFLVWGRRTRPLGWAWSLAFHGINKFLFSIGIFPVMSLALLTAWMPPDWPRRLLRWDRTVDHLPPPLRWRSPLAVLLALFCAWQVLMPLRHWLYPGDVAWTEEGHNFSWRMMLRSKRGYAEFRAVNTATGEERTVHPDIVLSSRQESQLDGNPYLILQTAHLIRDHGPFPPEHTAVFVNTCTSLNMRYCMPQVDPEVDLARVRANLMPSDWILPYDKWQVARPDPP